MRSPLLRAALTVSALVLGVVAIGVTPVATASAASAGETAVSAASAADAACAVEDATITWGFKESFRSYISGAIASGEWTVSGGAEYETPDFRFTGGSGLLEPDGTGLVEFPGSITFTGHGDILNTTVANPFVRFDGVDAMLLADVTGTTQDGSAVDERAVEFVTLQLSEAASTERTTGFWTVTGIPATLTDAGATAFGTYQAGEPFDPVTLDLGFDGECAIPAEGAAWLPWAVGGVVLAAAIAAGAILFRRRAQVTPPPLE